jgi:hypothetical protein
VIGDFADRMCSEIPLTSSTRSYEVEGRISAELEGLAKRLAELGLGAQGKLSDSEETAGILRADLAEALKHRDDCRFRYVQKLMDVFLPTTAAKEFALENDPFFSPPSNYCGYVTPKETESL